MRSLAVYALFFAVFASLLQVHAALPSNGTYTIQNVGTTAYLNLDGGSAQEGTPITGYKTPAGTGGFMKWIITRKGDRHLTIRNSYSNTYLDIPDERQGGQAIGSRSAGIFQILETQSDVYQINTVDDDYSLHLPQNAEGTRLVLRNNNNPRDNNQLWRLQRVFG